MDHDGRHTAGNDGSPVKQKPVSSLRSHFETLHTVRPAPASSVATTFRRPSQALDIPTATSTQSTPRQSLDIAHRPHQRTQSETIDKRIPPAPPKPRRSRPGTPAQDSHPILPQTPVLPQSPPRVDITSPRSPPKHIDIPRGIPPNLASIGSASSARPSPPSPIPSSPGHFRIPSRNVSPDGVHPTIPRSPRLEVDAYKFPHTPAKVDSPAQPVKTSKSSMGPRPPVNRAAKARVLSGEGALSSEPARVLPAPKALTASPFNSPPIGDAAGLKIGLDGSPPRATKPATAVPRSPAQPLFQRPPTHPQVAASRRQASGDMRGLGVGGPGATRGRPEDVADRPQLPPRRDLGLGRPSLEIPARISSELSRPSTMTLSMVSRTPGASGRVSSSSSMPPPSPRGFDSNSLPRSPLPPETILNFDGMGRTSPTRYGVGMPEQVIVSEEYPDSSTSNRRPPCYKDAPKSIATTYDLRQLDVCGEYVCCAGPTTRVWSVLTGKLVLSMNHGEGVRVTSMCFKPAANVKDEGNLLWLGTNWGEILEIDIGSRKTVATNSYAHARREIIRIFRHATELWTLDDEGKLFAWPTGDSGSPSLVDGVANPRLPRGHTASLCVDSCLWLATGKEIRVFKPSPLPGHASEITEEPLMQQGSGEIASVAVLSSQPDLIYFGHADGKISVYSRKTYQCQNIFSVSSYKVASLVGVGYFLWAGYSSGSIFVYDTTTSPWKIKKEFKGHAMPVVNMIADRTSIWKLDRLQVVSLGMDNNIKVWDGILEDDWIDDEMNRNDAQFCTFKDMTALVMTWNAGASKPTDLRYDEQNSNFFRNMLQAQEAPDVIVFSLQELVDLEDKRLTAKSFFKGKKQDAHGNEQLSSAYRAWRDHFSRSIEEHMPDSEPYALLHSASLVGLFTCIFVKSSLKAKIKDVHATEVKTGMGGLHGNKGAIVVRFLLDDSSLCFVNCHLAAGQTQTLARNHDISTILESTSLPVPHSAATARESFAHGGDGAMIMDHELCVINGDLNYRIEGMTRDFVTHAIDSRNLDKVLEHDQLLQTRRRNPTFVLRAFQEEPITFAPTYKYDVNTDRYDTSEKRRIPAWCDRILYRGTGDKLKQVDYKRHEVRVSDHRPVSGLFRLRIKTIQPGKRLEVRRRVEQEFKAVKRKVVNDALVDYWMSVHGLTADEAGKRV